MTRLTALLIGLTLTTAATAGGPPVRVRYLPTSATVDGARIIVRAGVEVTGPAHRWYTVYFQVRRNADQPLRTLSGKGDPLVKAWGQLFSPENVPTARWSDCRHAFSFDELSRCDLDPGRSTVLWLVCDLWDNATRTYLGHGWPQRVRVVVTTDAQGRVVTARVGKDPAEPALVGDWDLRFPDGKTRAVVRFEADGRWAWSVERGDGRPTRSKGRYAMSGDQLTLKHDGGPVQTFRVTWPADGRLLLTRGRVQLSGVRRAHATPAPDRAPGR